MIKEHRRSFKILRLVLDLALVTGCYYALYLGTIHLLNPLGLVLDAPDYRLRLPLVLGLCWGAALLASGTYEQSTRRAGLWDALMRSAKVLLLMLLIFALGLFAFKIQFLSRKFMVCYALACWLALGLSLSLAYAALRALRAMGFNTMSVLLVGEGEALRKLWLQFEGHQEWGYRVAGYLSTGGRAPAQGPRSLGSLKRLAEVLRTKVVDEVILAAPLSRAQALEGVLQQAAAAGVNVRLLMDDSLKAWQLQMDSLGSLSTLALSSGGGAPYWRLLKAAMDLVGGTLILILISPVLAAVSLAILVTMGRPVFFMQKRSGRNGRAFYLCKFRTMVQGARAEQEKLASKNQMSGPVFKVADDPRVTPLGRFLRRYSLDELPQIWNVLRGEISLVGPRPLAMYEARKVPAWAWRRYSVKPGITCLWQVMGRNQIDFKDWMKLDLEYIDTWSLWLDLKILLRTLPAVLGSKGAY
jgi:exopolysaccharide biosynthesis polyprenyl glycosylphosphotransferase